MATLGSKAVGSIVKIKVNGTAKDFIVVHQGKPSSLYDSSCTGTWLLMKDIYEKRAWDSTDNDYKNSDIYTYLNGTFLGLFDSSIKSAIKQVKIPYVNGTGSGGSVASGANGLSVKIFLLGGYEVGWTTSSHSSIPIDGAKLSYFSYGNDETSNKMRIANYNGSATQWWLRSPYMNKQFPKRICKVTEDGDSFMFTPCTEAHGIRPAFILPTTLIVDGTGNVIPNSAPTAPSSITVPSSIKGGSTASISWGSASDSDGNLSGYKLERSVNGGSYSQIYSGSSRSYTDSITKGWNTVQYRVKAYDSYGEESGYTTSPSRTVINNTAPTISGGSSSGSNLGEISAPFNFTYSVSDADGNTVTVKEYLDNVQQRSYTATLGATNTFQATSDAALFQKILNGSHTIKVIATDSAGASSSAYTVTFNKQVKTAAITLTEPLPADDVIKAAVVSITGNIPQDATLEVLVTNNALDTSPVWEDMSRDVKQGINHLFSNKTAANGFAFNFKVTVTRGASGEQGYISSIGGAFE